MAEESKTNLDNVVSDLKTQNNILTNMSSNIKGLVNAIISQGRAAAEEAKTRRSEEKKGFLQRLEDAREAAKEKRQGSFGGQFMRGLVGDTALAGVDAGGAGLGKLFHAGTFALGFLTMLAGKLITGGLLLALANYMGESLVDYIMGDGEGLSPEAKKELDANKKQLFSSLQMSALLLPFFGFTKAILGGVINYMFPEELTESGEAAIKALGIENTDFWKNLDDNTKELIKKNAAVVGGALLLGIMSRFGAPGIMAGIGATVIGADFAQNVKDGMDPNDAKSLAAFNMMGMGLGALVGARFGSPLVGAMLGGFMADSIAKQFPSLGPAVGDLGTEFAQGVAYDPKFDWMSAGIAGVVALGITKSPQAAMWAAMMGGFAGPKIYEGIGNAAKRLDIRMLGGDPDDPDSVRLHEELRSATTERLQIRSSGNMRYWEWSEDDPRTKRLKELDELIPRLEEWIALDNEIEGVKAGIAQYEKLLSESMGTLAEKGNRDMLERYRNELNNLLRQREERNKKDDDQSSLSPISYPVTNNSVPGLTKAALMSEMQWDIARGSMTIMPTVTGNNNVSQSYNTSSSNTYISGSNNDNYNTPFHSNNGVSA